jgi:hypothetical protein
MKDESVLGQVINTEYMNQKILCERRQISRFLQIGLNVVYNIEYLYNTNTRHTLNWKRLRYCSRKIGLMES